MVVRVNSTVVPLQSDPPTVQFGMICEGSAQPLTSPVIIVQDPYKGLDAGFFSLSSLLPQEMIALITTNVNKNLKVFITLCISLIKYITVA